MMINNKLDYIIENELVKINTDYIDKELSYLINNYSILHIKKPSFVMSEMEKLVNTLSCTKNITSLDNTNNLTKRFPKIETTQDVIQDQKIVTNISIPKKNEQLTHIIENYPIEILNKITHNNPDIIVLKFKKQNDYLSNCYFSSLSNLFYIMSNTQKNDELKEIKLNLINTFNKENYYKNFEYSTKYFKKIDADNIFSNNYSISLFMLKIYGDIIKTNIVFHSDKETIFITKYNVNYATVLICEKDDYIYTLTKKDGNFIRGTFFIDILEINKIPNKESLEKLKLDKLQNIAKMKNLCIKKQGKVGKINITKDELIQKITE